MWNLFKFPSPSHLKHIIMVLESRLKSLKTLDVNKKEKSLNYVEEFLGLLHSLVSERFLSAK